MTDIIAGFITWGIVFLFIHSFWESFSDPSKHITLTSYLTDFEDKSKPEVTLKEIHEPKKTTKTKLANIKPPPVPPAPKEDNLDLKRDCNSAMKSLKVPANERKYLLTKVFNDHSPKTVQEFITLAFKQ